MKIKIININPNPPAYEYVSKDYRPPYYWETKNEWLLIGRRDWSDLMGQAIRKEEENIEYEVWRPDHKADKEYTYTFPDGVKHRTFPSISRIKYTGLKKVTYVDSPHLIKELCREVEHSEDIIIHLNSAPTIPLNLKLIETFKNNRIVITFHGVFSSPRTQIFNLTKNLLAPISHIYNYSKLKNNLKYVDAITFQNEKHLHFLNQMNYLGQKKWLTMGCNFNFWNSDDKESVRDKMGIKASTKVLLMAARLTPLKQIDHLIEVLNKIELKYDFDYKLFIAGYGEIDHEHDLKKLSAGLREKGKVSFTGYLENKQLLQYYSAADMYMSMSTSEGCSVSVIQALSCNHDVFTTNVGGTTEILREYSAGVIVPVYDYFKWEQELIEVFQGKKIKQVDRDYSKSIFHWPNIANRTIGIYQNLYSHKRKKKYKVIKIMNHPPFYEAERNIQGLKATWFTQRGEILGTNGQDWPDLIAQSVLTATDEFEFEVWQPDYKADQVYSYQVNENLVHRLFPAKDVSQFYGIRKNEFIVSNHIINELFKLQDQNIILHLNAAYRYINVPILKKVKEKFPIIGQFYTNNSNVFSDTRSLNPVQYIHRIKIKKQLKDYYKFFEYIIPSVETGTENFEKNVSCEIKYRNVNICGEDLEKWSPNYSKIESKKNIGVNDDDFVIFSSSRLIDIKQIDLLIDELSKIKHLNYKCYISGRGNNQYEQYLEDRIKIHHLQDKIEMIGYVNHKTLKVYFEAADVIISTSLNDAGSQAVAYGMCLMKPIISTNIGTTYELLQKNKAGLIIDRKDSSQWHKIIESVINGDVKIPILSYEKVESYFSHKNVSQYYINLYKEAHKNFYKL